MQMARPNYSTKRRGIWKDSMAAVTVTLPVTREVKQVLLDSGIFNDVNAANNSAGRPGARSHAPVIAQAKNDTGTAALTMDLAAQVQAVRPRAVWPAVRRYSGTERTTRVQDTGRGHQG